MRGAKPLGAGFLILRFRPLKRKYVAKCCCITYISFLCHNVIIFHQYIPSQVASLPRFTHVLRQIVSFLASFFLISVLCFFQFNKKAYFCTREQPVVSLMQQPFSKRSPHTTHTLLYISTFQHYENPFFVRHSRLLARTRVRARLF